MEFFRHIGQFPRYLLESALQIRRLPSSDEATEILPRRAQAGKNLARSVHRIFAHVLEVALERSNFVRFLLQLLPLLLYALFGGGKR